MSFASLAQDPIAALIERFSETRDLTLLVGAGASMEAQLPSWPALIERMLTTVAAERPELTDDGERSAWVARTLEREDLLGAGAVVEVMAQGQLNDLVPQALYGNLGPEGFAPGPIAHQVAELQGEWGERARILTTNYDDLLEQALIDAGTPTSRVKSYTQNRAKRPAGTVGVTHLHGLARRAQEPRGIVLTEGHYHRMQRGSSWQERLVTERLGASSCLFVGMSLADPNLIRYLYGYRAPKPPRHAAIFVRQGEEVSSPAVRAALEQAVAARWGRCGVEPIFVDHFADAAQLLFEIGYRRSAGENYRPIGQRAAQMIGAVEAGLGIDEVERFGQLQVALSASLRKALESVLGDLLTAAGLEAREEIFGLTLWLLSRDGSGLISWGHSDRAHQDPSTVVAAPVEAGSKWVSVRTVCQGARVELDRDNYASRWRFIRGLPLVLPEPSRLPIGCLTLASSLPGDESVLRRMAPELRSTMHSVLEAVGLRLIHRLAEGGRGRAAGEGGPPLWTPMPRSSGESE